MPRSLKEYDWKAIGVSTFLLLAAVLAIHAAGYDVASYQQEYSARQANSDQESAEQTVAVYTKALAAFTGVLALFTVVLAGASLWQGYITQQSLKLAREEFLATHRPEIIIHSVTFTNVQQGTNEAKHDKSA